MERPILVDDLLGTGHKMYGALPNMTYIIGRSGRVLFRSDWTDPSTIELVLNYLLNVRARRRAGDRLAASLPDGSAAQTDAVRGKPGRRRADARVVRSRQHLSRKSDDRAGQLQQKMGETAGLAPIAQLSQRRTAEKERWRGSKPAKMPRTTRSTKVLPLPTANRASIMFSRAPSKT